MIGVPTYRGQPLIALMLVLGGWVAVRTIVWDMDGGLPSPSLALPGIPDIVVAVPDRAGPSPIAREPQSAPAADWSPEVSAPAPFNPKPAVPAGAVPLAPYGPAPYNGPYIEAQPVATFEPNELRGAPSPVPAQVSAGHQLLWMASLTNVAVKTSYIQPRAAPTPVQPIARGKRASTWSADTWLLLRRGGIGPAVGGFAAPTYGASQAGGVIRYRFRPEDPHRPTLYGRASAALNGSREREVAFGISARPIARVPVVAAIEGRVNKQPNGTNIRPAALAYTEVPPFALPLGTRGEFYGQAGYVGGNFSTAFVDGQLRVDRRVGAIGKGEVRAGAGVWGGAQRGASRLDVGPTATVGMPIGDSAAARLGVDWRFRVAGNAGPESGPAVTLSAGF